MILPRDIAPAVLERSRKYPVISITGPRQSGKTTLARILFPDYPYISLERPDYRKQALEDPNRFLHTCSNGVILDVGLGKGCLICGGKEGQARKNGRVLGWPEVDRITGLAAEGRPLSPVTP